MSCLNISAQVTVATCVETAPMEWRLRQTLAMTIFKGPAKPHARIASARQGRARHPHPVLSSSFCRTCTRTREANPRRGFVIYRKSAFGAHLAGDTPVYF